MLMGRFVIWGPLVDTMSAGFVDPPVVTRRLELNSKPDWYRWSYRLINVAALK